MKGKVQTVLGLIEPEELGITLTHEHLLHELKVEVFLQPWPSKIPQTRTTEVTLENLGWIKQYPYSFTENIKFSEDIVKDAVAKEMHFYKQIGGGTLVDNCSIGLRAKNHAIYLKNLALQAGINIIAGTGFYVASSQSSETLKMSQEMMEKIIKTDITEGIGESEIRCGVIGEIGCSWPLESFERQVLKSSATVQEELGCPVIIHPGRSKQSPEEILRIFQEAGGKANRTVMSHLERTIIDKGELAEFASLGCYCEMDLFGIEASHYQLSEDVDMPSDAQRISHLRYLVEQGFSEKIVVSHDIHTKHRLMHFGGHGYSHILLNIVPKMLKRGISQDVIDKFLTYNPMQWLTFQ